MLMHSRPPIPQGRGFAAAHGLPVTAFIGLQCKRAELGQPGFPCVHAFRAILRRGCPGRRTRNLRNLTASRAWQHRYISLGLAARLC